MVKKGKVARSKTIRCYVIDCRNFGLHPSTREKREKDVFKNRIPLRRSFRLKSVHRRIPVYMFMESQDKSIVMSSIVEILVYIRLHEKNEKKAFSKIRFHSGELSD